MEDEEIHEAYLKAIEIDKANIDGAMDALIDSVSRFKSISSTEELSDEDFADMLGALDGARFIIAGVMYLHGKWPCGEEHDEEDED